MPYADGASVRLPGAMWLISSAPVQVRYREARDWRDEVRRLRGSFA
jgi:hypothetical protein